MVEELRNSLVPLQKGGPHAESLLDEEALPPADVQKVTPKPLALVFRNNMVRQTASVI
jgi:hypothetical protein